MLCHPTPSKESIMNPTYRISIGVLALLSSSVAVATPARVASLAGAQGFTDDTDFMVYPTEASQVGQSAWFHYDGDYTGAMTWDDNAVVAGLGGNGWDMSWTNSQDSTAYSVNASYLVNDDVEGEGFTLGGAWGTADRSDGLANLAVGGNLGIATIGDDTAIDVAAGASSRTLGEADFSTWAAGLGYASVGDASSLNLAGQYFMGPRMGDDQASATLGIGAQAWVNADLGDDGSTQIWASLPSSTIAGEFAFNDWLMIRGAVVAAILVSHDGDEVDTATLVSGSAGLGISGERGGLDLTINPDWALAGPHILTGTPADMVGVITARFEI
jgi:hypothetical protein